MDWLNPETLTTLRLMITMTGGMIVCIIITRMLDGLIARAPANSGGALQFVLMPLVLH